MKNFTSKFRAKYSQVKKLAFPEVFSPKKKIPKMRIDDQIEPNYEMVKVSKVGFTAPLAINGAVILSSEKGREFPISSFSGEVASYISNFIQQKRNDIPSIYNMLEQICEENEIVLVKVKVYESGDALRANLYFTGKKDLVLRNYRASDAIALATFYNVPILLRKSLLEKTIEPLK